MKEYRKELKAFTCPMCGKQDYGRPDKKFCSVRCKNEWHNMHARQGRLYRNRIITALGRNYTILCDALERGELSIDLLTLQDRGFRPCYITGYTPARYGNDKFRCFDISFCRSASRIYKIRREEAD